MLYSLNITCAFSSYILHGLLYKSSPGISNGESPLQYVVTSNLFVISWKNSLDSIGANSREKNVSK